MKENRVSNILSQCGFIKYYDWDACQFPGPSLTDFRFSTQTRNLEVLMVRSTANAIIPCQQIVDTVKSGKLIPIFYAHCSLQIVCNFTTQDNPHVFVAQENGTRMSSQTKT